MTIIAYLMTKVSKFIKFILSLAERVTKIVKGLFSTSGPYRSKNTSIRYLVGKLTKLMVPVSQKENRTKNFNIAPCCKRNKRFTLN